MLASVLRSPLLARRMILRTAAVRTPLLQLALSDMAHKAVAGSHSSPAPSSAFLGSSRPPVHQQINWSAPGAHAPPAALAHKARECRALHASRADSGMQPAVADTAAQRVDSVADLTSRQRQQVDGFVTFLLQENEKMNLTGACLACC